MAAKIRAKHVKHNLAAITAMSSADDCARIRAAMGDATVRAIEEAPRTAWLDVQHDINLAQGVTDVLGLEGDRTRARTALRISMDGALLRPMVDGATRLFGLTPSSILRVAGRAWGAIYRDAGAIRVHHDGERHVRIAYAEIDADILRSEVYLASISGALLATFDLCKVEGTVNVENLDRQAATAEFHFRW